jgi:gamma-glutamyltranspeptidase/glutathione hydrolase
LFKVPVSISRKEGNEGRRPFQRAVGVGLWRGLIASLPLIIAACAGDVDEDVVVVEGFSGLVAADEPRAAVIGQEVLANGGSAADAGVAMYFAMAVTLPSRAGLGGGGACIAFTSNSFDDEAAPFVDAYVFPASAMAGAMPRPMNARAMGVIHARHGRVRWEELVSHGEKLARFGYPVSRAFANDLASGREAVFGDRGLRRGLSRPDGGLAREGDVLTQEALAATLAGIRSKGAGYLYKGPFADRLVDGYARLGLALSKEELWNSLPANPEPIVVGFGWSDEAYFAPPPADGGLISAQMWQILEQVQNFDGVEDASGFHLLAEASLAAYAERGKWLGRDGTTPRPVAELVAEDHLEEVFDAYDSKQHRAPATFDPPPQRVPSDPWAAGFIAADPFGDAIACSFTMNAAFGSGRMMEDSGIVVAAPTRFGASNLTPVVVGNPNTGDLRFAASASGGIAAPSALIQTMAVAWDADGDLVEAVAMPRVAHVGAPDVTWVEAGMPEEVKSALVARGHDVQPTREIGRVLALFCPEGILDGPDDCEVVADKRGNGMGLRAQ